MSQISHLPFAAHNRHGAPKPSQNSKKAGQSKRTSASSHSDNENSEPEPDSVRKKSGKTSNHGLVQSSGRDSERQLRQKILAQEAQAKATQRRMSDIGRVIARLDCPMHDIAEVFHWTRAERRGTKLTGAAQKLYASIGREIFSRFEELDDLIAANGIQSVIAQIKKARDAARQTDTNAIRKALMVWRGWGIPNEHRNDKLYRGWANIDMAMLLLPRGMIFTPALAEKLKANEVHVSEQDMPALLFEDDDPERVEGFMKNELLFQVATTILLGQNASISKNARAGPGNTAQKFGIQTVTETFMAYTACLLRFALSSETSLTIDGAQGFNYIDFFDAIMDRFQRNKSMGENGEGLMLWQELMEHWDTRILTHHGRASANAIVTAAENAERLQRIDEAFDDEWMRYANERAEERRSYLFDDHALDNQPDDQPDDQLGNENDNENPGGHAARGRQAPQYDDDGQLYTSEHQELARTERRIGSNSANGSTRQSYERDSDDERGAPSRHLKRGWNVVRDEDDPDVEARKTRRLRK